MWRLCLAAAAVASAAAQLSCPPDWILGEASEKCYRLPEAHSRSKNFSDAEASCRLFNGTLPFFINTTAEFPEFKRITTELMGNDPNSWSYVWAGCRKVAHNGTGDQWRCAHPDTELPTLANWSPSHSNGGKAEECLTVFRWPTDSELGYDDYSCNLTDYIRVVTVCSIDPCELVSWGSWGACSRSCGYATQTRRRKRQSLCAAENRVCPENLPCFDSSRKEEARPRFLGELAVFPYDFEPKGWVRADGRLLRMDDYYALYTLLRSKFGGDGTTTFAIPAKFSKETPYFIAVKGPYPRSDLGHVVTSTTPKPTTSTTAVPTDGTSTAPSTSTSRTSPVPAALRRRARLHI